MFDNYTITINIDEVGTQVERDGFTLDNFTLV